MIRGFYGSTAGMATHAQVVDVLSNDIANVNTNGFKEDFTTLTRVDANPLSYGGPVRGTGYLNNPVQVDLTQGKLIDSPNPLTTALTGSGMFALQNGNGTLYTRNGSFHLDPNGRLTSEGGYLVLGTNGQPITLPPVQGKPISIRPDGVISVGDQTVGQIGVFGATQWTKVGNNLYQPTGPVSLTATPIAQHTTEASNTDVSSTLGLIMSTQRAYEASIQMQKTIDQMLQISVNDLGKL